MAAVSNSSPLILFAKIGRLDILHAVFAEILIPPAVRDELGLSSPERSDAVAIVAAPWIRILQVTNDVHLESLQWDLDAGEAEAVALALDLGGSTPVILDGVLISAKQRGVISAVRPLLDGLRAAGMYLGDLEFQKALALAGERPRA